MKKLLLLIAYIICFIVGLLFADSILALATYPYDVLIWIGMICGFLYLYRNHREGFVQLFKDVHQSNLDDVKAQELQAELIAKYRDSEEEVNWKNLPLKTHAEIDVLSNMWYNRGIDEENFKYH